jgi:hypothetical protein
MKKIISLKLKSVMTITLCALALSFSTPPKAEAGIIIAALTTGDTSDTAFFLSFVGMGVLVAAGGTSISNGVGVTPSIRTTMIAAGAVAILDADGSVSSDQAVRSFANRFPEVDNADIAKDFAVRLKAKFNALYSANPGASAWMVHFSQEETGSLLAPAIGSSLSSEQVTRIAAELE